MTNESWMLREIKEQPAAIQDTLREERGRVERIAASIARRDPAFMMIAARGSSDNAATYGKYLWGAYNGLPVALAAPALTTLYNATPRLRDAVVVGISQSGESTDVVEVVRAARAQGALTVGVTSAEHSALAASADEVIVCRTGTERSVAATKTYTTQLTALCLLSAVLARESELLAALDGVPEAVERILDEEDRIGELASRYRAMGSCAVLARGFNYCTALEMALKMKETGYVMAEPYSAADFMHGPIAIVEPGFPVAIIAPPGRSAGPMAVLASDLHAKGAATIVFSSDAAALAGASVPVALPAPVASGLAGEAVSPIVYAAAAQLFAHALAQAKGLNPDEPRGLKKVTLTL